MRARLRLSRQLEYASAGQTAQAAEEGRSIDAALDEARRQQTAFVALARKDAPPARLDPMQASFDALVTGGIARRRDGEPRLRQEHRGLRGLRQAA
ncbi:hypothetical protein G6F66_015368 [Rhizopus arrhizus]|nr:hypothetical protein G6F66_015368 [Rhizopus arrhizus]